MGTTLGVIDDGDIVWINGVKIGEGYGYTNGDL